MNKRTPILERVLSRLDKAGAEAHKRQQNKAIAQMIAKRMEENAVYFFFLEDTEKLLIIASLKRITTQH